MYFFVSIILKILVLSVRRMTGSHFQITIYHYLEFSHYFMQYTGSRSIRPLFYTRSHFGHHKTGTQISHPILELFFIFEYFIAKFTL